MALMPWRPFGELSSIRREMDRLWDRVFGEAPLARTFAEEWSPRVDLAEITDSFIVNTKLPRLDAKDMDVSISGNVLIIKGKKKQEGGEIC